MGASRARSRLTQQTIILLLLVVASFLPASGQLTQVAGGAVDHVESSKENASLRTQLIHGIHSENVNKEDGSTRDDEWVVDANSDFASAGGLFDALFASFSMILVSEIGDETFIIAALLAMRHPRSIVLSGALSALIIMTVLSTGLGRIVPNLISRKHTNSAATILYTFFGLRLLYISWRSSSKNTQQKEFEEVEEKLEGAPQGKTIWRRILSRFCTPIFLEAFILTFLAEWGDRSQIATIAVNVDQFKLTGDTLKSVNKEVDDEEERIYAELYKELEETDRRISRTRHGRSTTSEGSKDKGKAKSKGKGATRRASVRRGSSSALAAIEPNVNEDDLVPPIETLREPEYDDDGNLLSEGDFIFDSETEEEEEYALEDLLASDHSSDDDSFAISP